MDMRTGRRLRLLLALVLEDIINIGLNLPDNNFYKTIGSIKFPDKMQDIYRTKYNGISIYYKVQIAGKTIVISCKDL